MSGKTTTISLAVGMLMVVGFMVYMSEGMLKEPIRLLRSLKPKGADAADGEATRADRQSNTPPQQAAEPSGSKTSLTRMIRRGMSRRDVEDLLGLPAIVTTRNERRSDGQWVQFQSAVWLKTPEKITVSFCDGLVQAVTTAPLGNLPVAETPPEAKETHKSAKKQTAASDSDKNQIPKELCEQIRDLEKQLKKRK
ncbi:MAG: hypothetical protein SVT52_03455 [Planctomycetota bacterium]|nr:hypothetical protein [Planctomycetota bacterium]